MTMNMNTRVSEGSRRGSKVSIHNGFKYQKNKPNQNGIFWRCWRKDCGVFVKTGVFNTDDANVNINFLKEGEHEHDADEERIQQDRFKNSLRNEIVTN